MTELLRLDGLRKDFGQVRALGPLTATLEPGAWGLLGPNGSGKTTLILTLLGLLTPTGGRARVLGMDPTADPLAVRSAVGFVPEGDSFVPGYTGVGFVAFCGALMGMKRADALGRAHEVLDHVGLGEARYRKITEYSTGMRQRAKLAAALVHDPQLLVLDEPTNGLDPAGRKEMILVLRDLAYKHKIPLLYASHVLPDVEEICDRIVILEKGQARFVGPIQQLLAEAERTYDLDVRVNPNAVATALRAHGVHVTPGAKPGALRVILPGAGQEEMILRAVVESGARLRGMRQVARGLEESFTDALAPEVAA